MSALSPQSEPTSDSMLSNELIQETSIIHNKNKLLNRFTMGIVGIIVIIAIVFVLSQITQNDATSKLTTTPTLLPSPVLTVTQRPKITPIAPTRTYTEINGAFTANVEINSAKTAKFTKASLPTYLSFPLIIVPATQTEPETNVVYFGSFNGINLIYIKEDAGEEKTLDRVYLQDGKGKWSEYGRTTSTDEVTPTPTIPIKFNDIKNKYILIKSSSPYASYGVGTTESLTDILNSKLYIPVYFDNFDDVSGDAVRYLMLANINLKTMQLEKVIVNVNVPKYGGPFIPESVVGPYLITSLTSCFQCDEYLSSLLVINWDSGTMKYLGEGDVIGDYKINTTKKTITYKPQTLDHLVTSGEGTGNPVYKFGKEVTIALP